MNFRSKENIRKDDNIRVDSQPYILSQYAASSKMLSLINVFKKEIAPREDYLLFYRSIFNIDTAEGIGLDIWGRIVGIGRNISDESTGFFMTLDDEHYRTLLMYKALANIMESTIPSLKQLIDLLYSSDDGEVITVEDYVQNTEGVFYNQKPMHIRWVFSKYFSDYELALFKVAGTLCRGAGVGWGLYAIDTDSVFGFDGSGLQPFNQGVFDPIGVIEG